MILKEKGVALLTLRHITPKQPYLEIKTKTKVPVILILNNIFKYTVILISPASGKMLKLSYNDKTSLAMKATTVRCVAHKISKNLYKRKQSK